MTVEEIEKYILSKSFSKKTLISQWKYIRYTIYSKMFASIGETNKGTVLTIWGKFSNYRLLYKGIITAAIDNEPQCFTSIILKKANQLPEHIIKSMIDYAYLERQKDVPIPIVATEGFENIKYCAIPPLQINIQKEIFPNQLNNIVFNSEECGESVTLESDGKWNNVPYRSSAPKNSNNDKKW